MAGRRPLPEEERRTELVRARLTPGEMRKVNRFSAESGENESTVLRQGLAALERERERERRKER